MINQYKFEILSYLELHTKPKFAAQSWKYGHARLNNMV